MPWDVPAFLPSKTVSTLMRCGPDVFLTGSAAWDDANIRKLINPNYVERSRCGMEGVETMPLRLYEHRVGMMMKDGCELYGPDRFVWRTGNYGRNFTSVPELNRQARRIASRVGVRILDYEALSSYYSDAVMDRVHPPPVLCMRAVLAVYNHLMVTLKGLKRHRTVQYLRDSLYRELQLHHQNKVSNTNWEVGSFIGLYKTVSPERMAELGKDSDMWTKEADNRAPWSVQFVARRSP